MVKAATLEEGHKLLLAKNNQEFPYTGLPLINKYSCISKYHWHQVFEEAVVKATFSNAYHML